MKDNFSNAIYIDYSAIYQEFNKNNKKIYINYIGGNKFLS